MTPAGAIAWVRRIPCARTPQLAPALFIQFVMFWSIVLIVSLFRSFAPIEIEEFAWTTG